MELEISSIRKNLLEEEKQIKALEDTLKLFKKSPCACQKLWESEELIFVILQYLTGSFFILSTDLFTEQEINKVKICLDVLTIISQNAKITSQFLKLQLDFYIYPFLSVNSNQILKTSALSLFISLLKEGLPEQMKGGELIPRLLKIIDSESENCQKLALKTLEMILNGGGLDYAVQTIDRFQAIDVVLSSLLKKSILNRNDSILIILLKIYCRLCDKPNVRGKLKEKSPEGLDSKDFVEFCSKNDELNVLRLKFINLLS
jgi:CCR4-NOT transcription complex subunit 9